MNTHTMAPPSPAAQAQATAAGSGVTLKLYIDSTSLSVIHQMADFVASAEQRNVVKVVTWLRCPLDENQLAAYSALYLKQLAAVTPQFVSAVCQLVQRVGAQRLVVHSNHHHARNGVLPVLRTLLARGQLTPEQIELHLYDDGRLSLRHRGELAATPDLGTTLDQGATALRRWLLDGVAAPWNIATSYGWQHTVRTTYHMLRPELLLAAPAATALPEALRQAMRCMRFDHAQTLGPALWQRYLGHYGLDVAGRRALRQFAQQPSSFLFVGTAVWDKTDNARYRDLQLRSMAALRQRGLLPAGGAGGALGFKGHPANSDHEPELRRALGEACVQVPARLPLEVMMMDGLLPARLDGVISSAYLTLPPEKLAFMLCDDTDAAACLQHPDVRLLLDLGLVTEAQVFPWLDAAAPATGGDPPRERARDPVR